MAALEQLGDIAAPPTLPRLHPNLSELYRWQVARLEEVLDTLHRPAHAGLAVTVRSNQNPDYPGVGNLAA